MDTTQYAKAVVPQVLAARGFVQQGEIWAGGQVGLVWFTQWIELYWPWGIYGFMMRKMFGLDRLGAKH